MCPLPEPVFRPLRGFAGAAGDSSTASAFVPPAASYRRRIALNSKTTYVVYTIITQHKSKRKYFYNICCKIFLEVEL